MRTLSVLLVASMLSLLSLNANGQVLRRTMSKSPVLRASLPTAMAKAKYVFTMIKPIESTRPVFTDESITIGFVLNQGQFAFELLNKTNNVIKVLWNQTSYIKP